MNEQIRSVLAIAFQFSSLYYEYDCYVISRRVGTEKKDECESTDRIFLRRSIGVHSNECERYSVRSTEFRSFSHERSPARERDISCLHQPKKLEQSVTITRESHSPHFWREKRTASTVKLQCVPSFSLSDTEFVAFVKLDETQRKTRRKFTRATVFHRDHGGSFSFRDPREILVLEVWRSTAPLFYLEIKSSKIRLFLQTRDLMYLVHEPRYHVEVSAKSNWRRNLTILVIWTLPSFSSEIVASFRKVTIK